MTFSITVRTTLFANSSVILKMATNLSQDLGSMRAKYRSKNNVFTENHLVSKEPIEQFKNWFDEASQTPEILEPNAMCLATCSRNGFPSARYVLLKGFGKDGFKFFTHYTSRKGREIEENPNAALVFYWEPLRRSVRIEGVVEKLPDKDAIDYFHSRPVDSQIGSACSNQSQPVSGREALQKSELQLREKYAGCDKIPKPNEWGGYILKPRSVEFWQGQSDRIHDRIRFRIPNENEVVDNVLLHAGINGWVYERLQP